MDLETCRVESNEGSIVTKEKALGYSYIFIDRNEEPVHKETCMGYNTINNFLQSISISWNEIKTT